MNKHPIAATATIFNRISPAVVLMVCLTISTVLLITFSWFVWDMLKHYKTFQHLSLRVQMLSDAFVYCDEALTMSAKMAAATGEQNWEKRYLFFDKKLTEALKEAETILPEAFIGKATLAVDEANTKLVKMEKQAFLFVHQRNLKAAADLLASKEYELQKGIYRDGINKLDTLMNDFAERNLTVLQREMIIVAFACMLVTMILFLVMFGGMRVLNRHIARIKQVETELQKSNDNLEVKIEERTADLNLILRKQEARNLQNVILSEMREFLQASLTTQEVGPVIIRSMKKLFPTSDGALFLLSPSKTDLETTTRWGDFPEDMDNNTFPPDACWGLRKGGVYMVENVENSLPCPHLKNLPIASYACLPMMAKGEVLGLLHIRERSGKNDKHMQQWFLDLKDISSVLSEMLSLSISNIRLSETLSIQSIKDPLTGLYNRRYMEENFRREISRAVRKQNQIGVVMIDIDHFKTFNDLHGHAAGDAVLADLAGFFKARMRESDIACRHGGEEFVLFFPESSLEDTSKRASQMVEEIRTLRITYEGQFLGPITISMGVAAYPRHGTTPEDLLRAADTALYRAKHEGRDRVAIA